MPVNGCSSGSCREIPCQLLQLIMTGPAIQLGIEPRDLLKADDIGQPHIGDYTGNTTRSILPSTPSPHCMFHEMIRMGQPSNSRIAISMSAISVNPAPQAHR